MSAELNVDAVKTFVVDLWEDLTRTRLASVAVGLGLALVVITALVLKPAGPPHVSDEFATPIPAAEEEVSFVVPDDTPTDLADVKLSAPRDPMRSLDPGSEADSQTLLAAGEELRDAVISTALGGGAPVGSGYGGAGGSSLLPLDDLSPASTPAPVADPQPRAPASAPVTDYSYTADVQFGRVDDLRRYATVQRLDLIPSRRSPLVMYLGVSTDHETAVFMVDSRLSQGGEGRCVPKASLCTFLELRATPSQDEHHFRDADGNEYLLRLRGLTRTVAEPGDSGDRHGAVLDGSPDLLDGAR